MDAYIIPPKDGANSYTDWVTLLLNHIENVLDDANFAKIDAQIWNTVSSFNVSVLSQPPAVAVSYVSTRTGTGEPYPPPTMPDGRTPDLTITKVAQPPAVESQDAVFPTVRYLEKLMKSDLPLVANAARTLLDYYQGVTAVGAPKEIKAPTRDYLGMGREAFRAGASNDPFPLIGKAAEWWIAGYRYEASLSKSPAVEAPSFDKWLIYDANKYGERGLSQLEIDQMRDAYNGAIASLPTSLPKVEAPSEESWKHHARKLTQWRLCMSYNDSYFGEPAGLVKQVAHELELLLDSTAPHVPLLKTETPKAMVLNPYRNAEAHGAGPEPTYVPVPLSKAEAPSIPTYQERLGGEVDWQLSPAERCMVAEIRDLRAALVPSAVQPASSIRELHKAILALRCAPGYSTYTIVGFGAGVHAAATIVSNWTGSTVQLTDQEVIERFNLWVKDHPVRAQSKEEILALLEGLAAQPTIEDVEKENVILHRIVDKLGARIIELEASVAAQPADTCAQMRALCSACGGTGDIHRADGEWLGSCDCEASKGAIPAAQPAVAVQGYEAQRALMEGELYPAREEYFNSWTRRDCAVNRRIYEDAFKRGFETNAIQPAQGKQAEDRPCRYCEPNHLCVFHRTDAQGTQSNVLAILNGARRYGLDTLSANYGSDESFKKLLLEDVAEMTRRISDAAALVSSAAQPAQELTMALYKIACKYGVYESSAFKLADDVLALLGAAQGTQAVPPQDQLKLERNGAGSLILEKNATIKAYQAVLEKQAGTQAVPSFEQIKLWFFRDLVNADRFKLFNLCGLESLDEVNRPLPHGIQLKLFKALFAAPKPPADQDGGAS